MVFEPGHEKKGGRAVGTPNRVTIEARDLANKIVDNEDYQARLLKDALSGDLHPTIESMLWHYAKGKPVQRVEADAGSTLIAALQAIGKDGDDGE